MVPAASSNGCFVVECGKLAFICFFKNFRFEEILNFGVLFCRMLNNAKFAKSLWYFILSTKFLDLANRTNLYIPSGHCKYFGNRLETAMCCCVSAANIFGSTGRLQNVVVSPLSQIFLPGRWNEDMSFQKSWWCNDKQQKDISMTIRKYFCL